jgi:hypothetical protein
VVTVRSSRCAASTTMTVISEFSDTVRIHSWGLVGRTRRS